MAVDTMDLTPTTELEAINLMLATIGESPVNTVEDNGVVDAVMARQQLRAMSRRVQAKGWHWNTEKRLTLARTYPEGEIKLPANTLRVDTTYTDIGTDVVRRGDRLYDRVNHTFEFRRDLMVDLVVFLPFEELPESARQYITLAAARKFQESQVGSETLSKFSMRDELLALSDLQNDEGETGDYNVLDEHYGPGGALAR